jgi:hypothetical protein
VIPVISRGPRIRLRGPAYQHDERDEAKKAADQTFNEITFYILQNR